MEQLLEESGKSRREAQETAVFCQVDNMMYSALPRAEFLYPADRQADRKGRDYVRLHFQKKITAFY